MHVVLLTSMECIIHYDRTTTSSTVSSGTTGKAQDTLSKPRLWWFDQQISKCFCIMWIMYCLVFKDLICWACKHTFATCLIFKPRKHVLVFWRDQFSRIPELQKPWSAKAHITQPDAKSKASTSYNRELAKRLNEKNIQGTARQLKNFALLIVYFMYVLVNNWNCEKYLK